ncbi:unnamed protein product [Urochloa humidicola]
MASPSTDDEIDEHLFDGVHFFLVGFESDVEFLYRSEMERRGGAAAGSSGNGCTHVVVSNLVYDDPTCVAAREEGKKVVNGFWVDDSLENGVLADADRVIYWPMRHLEGIPGAQSLLICLTGYQRNYRQYITKLVSLMGARFSKSLIANVVTHLICYKFEGEKYEVAKKVNIKLVNHRWLEDCLKAWEILPVDDYSKSSWELELMEAQVNDSEDEAEAAGPRSSNNRSSVSASREVVVGRNLNSPGHIMKTKGADRKMHDIAGQSNANSMVAVSAKVDVFTPIQGPSGHIMKTEDADSKTHNITGQGSRHSSLLAVSPKEAEERYVGVRIQDLGCGVGTPSSSKMISLSNHHLNARNDTPGMLNGNKDHVSGKSTVSHKQIDVTKVLLTSPSRGNQSVDKLASSKVDKWQHQEKDGPSGIDTTAAGRTNTDDELTPKPGGDSKCNSMKNTSKSKKASQNSLLPEVHSANHMASPKIAEESTLLAGSNIKSVDGLDGAYAQKRKSLVSPASLNLQKEDLVLETGLLGAPFMSRLSDASDTEANAVSFGKQQSCLSTSRQTRSRKTSLKHGGPSTGIKLPGSSPSDNNVKSVSKTRMSLKEMAENKCTTSPSPTVQDGKTSSGFSFQNTDRQNTKGSGNAANKDIFLEIGNALTKGLTRDDKSKHSSSNSQVVSSSGRSSTKITDALKVNDNETAVVSNSKVEKVVSDASVKESTKRFQDTSSNVQGGTSYSKKEATSIRRSADAKRCRSASIEAEGSAINSGNKLVPESLPDEVIPHEHADPASKKGCSTASLAELKSNPPNKAQICRGTDTVAKRTRNACVKIDDAWVASGLEFNNVISEENIDINLKKVFDTKNVDELQRNSPKKLPNTRVRNTVVKRSQKCDTNTNNEMLVDKTETVAAGSLFDDLFPSDNVEDYPKKLSSCASAGDCGTLTPKTIPNARIRNAVAKKKIKTLEDKSGSKCGKIGSAIASIAKAVASRRTEETSCSINKVTTDQDVIRDVSELFCQDSGTVDKQEGPHDSKLRSSKRNKVMMSDHGKENNLDCSNLNSKPNRTGSMRSKFDAKSIEKSTEVFSEHQGVKGSEPGTLIVSEPALFILSGSREQRRDYRSIIRRLKGRVCRDSHHWSYQATHFIAQYPLRRTEKFFAAAAAGRWILKREYLTSCIEAGRFLYEEPFEWFGTGLNDGETISLDAPRKWRSIRQQMGHGAFYGMQIVIYGQLILPTLDTVKRAVKAGDGTILATSPPYTRFVDSGVDFAVVSLSIPRADVRVQEFIRHGIPCVSADYLVEYVCKPGQPLEKHVLFKTNDLAHKSLTKLLKNQQQMATEETEQSEDDDDPEDLSCSACGSKDRGEVMLICGDEDGKIGCGIGMHIDCCNPPLDAVPDEDWLCPSCAVPKAKRKPTKGTERKTRGSR